MEPKDGQYDILDEEDLSWMSADEELSYMARQAKNSKRLMENILKRTHNEKRPFKVPARPTAFFDVDDTLVMWDLPEGVDINDERLVSINCKGIEDRLFPNKYNIDLLKKFSARGHSVVVWSGGGADWAEAVVDALGLNEYVEVVMNKPQYYMDDIANPKEWIGKHGYFKIDGTRVNGDNLSKGDY